MSKQASKSGICEVVWIHHMSPSNAIHIPETLERGQLRHVVASFIYIYIHRLCTYEQSTNHILPLEVECQSHRQLYTTDLLPCKQDLSNIFRNFWLGSSMLIHEIVSQYIYIHLQSSWSKLEKAIFNVHLVLVKVFKYVQILSAPRRLCVGQ